MKITKMIRYTGLGLLIFSVVILLYLGSFTLLKDKKAQSEDQYAVLEISAGVHVFPETGFDALFCGMNMASNSIQIDKVLSLEDQQTTINTAISEMNSRHVILLATKGAGMPALNAALSNKDVASVILMWPSLDENIDANTFGTHLPDIPVAIIDVKTEYSTSLYERLSGEDASLLPGHTDSGYPDSTEFISPDAKRYLCQWNFPWQSEEGRSALLFLPQNQIKTGEFISTFVLGTSGNPDMNIRTSVVRMQIMVLLAEVFLASGLLLFFASIPKKRRENLRRTDSSDSDITAASNPTRIDTSDSVRAVYDKRAVSGNTLFITVLLFAVLFAAVTIALYSIRFSYAADVLGCWPAFYYAVFSVFFLRKVKLIKSTSRVPLKRIIFSSFVALLFAAGIYLTVGMNIVSFREKLTEGRGILLFFVSILMAIFVWIQMSADEISTKPMPQKETEPDRRSKWYRSASLLFPYIAVLIFSLVSGRTGVAIHCGVLLFALALAAWIRLAFRRMSGTKWLAAIMFALIYSLIAFA